MNDYSAKDITVLKGLEPVRLRPGMYIGGTDARALHHLFAEVIDNSMDEAVAGHATRIEVELDNGGYLSVTDNGRGIPVDPHPDYKNKSALEVIMTELHSGGKFDNGAYETSGGLHGVGVSVVNALSDHMIVEVAREKKLYRQSFKRGKPIGKLEHLGDITNRRGTKNFLSSRRRNLRVKNTVLPCPSVSHGTRQSISPTGRRNSLEMRARIGREFRDHTRRSRIPFPGRLSRFPQRNTGQ